MVNATEMAKPFGKRTTHWLSNQQTKEFIKELSAVRNLTPTDLVIVKNGGTDFGTWMHEDVALEFARWLNPAFAIWCNDRIKELIKEGVTTISNDDEVIAKAMEVLNRRLEENRQRLQMAEDTIKAQQPKVLFADAVSASKTSILIGELAKILKQNGIEVGQNRLFQRLREEGYLISRKGTDFNMPTQRAMALGLFEIKETSISHSDGHISISKTPKVTGKGQCYFIQKYLNNRSLKIN